MSQEDIYFTQCATGDSRSPGSGPKTTQTHGVRLAIYKTIGKV